MKWNVLPIIRKNIVGVFFKKEIQNGKRMRRNDVVGGY